MTTYIGIDPGKTGAIAFLFENGVDVIDMPTNPRDLWEALWEIGDNPDAVVYIEKQQAMPGQGVSSTFQTGYGYGLIIGTLASLGLSYHEVTPGTWKRAMGLTKAKEETVEQAKEKSRAMARSLWPTASLSRKKDHNRSEALLIARYGQTQEAR